MPSNYNTKNKADLHYLSIIFSISHVHNVIRFQIMSPFRSFFQKDSPRGSYTTKTYPSLLDSLPSCIFYINFTQQLEILMTVLPQDNDEHPCHFDMETPFGDGEGEVSGCILIKFDAGAPQLQGGKTFCASFCTSLIAGSRRAFLCVDRVRLFVCFSQREFWLRLNEMHKVWTFSSRKAFFLCVAFVFRHLKITLDSDQPMLKEKRIIPSVWGGIKSFEHFQRGEYFSDCSFDLFVTWFRLLSPGWIRTRFFFLLVNTFSHAQIHSLGRPALSFSSVKEPFCAP